MKPLVSIVTPSYNQGRFIRQTIESVLSQDYENLEYIIVDGGSTDNTHEIVKEYQDKLTYISEKDNGQSDAINKGFKLAKGEIVAWLNSDDTYEPNCISRAVEEFEENKNLGLVYGDGYIIDENSQKLKIFEATQEFDLWTLINIWDYIMQPTTFFRAKFLKEVEYLNVDLNWCMDWDLWIKLALVSEVKYVKEIFACSREYGDTKTSTGGDKRMDEITALMQKYSGKEKPLGVQLYRSSTLYTKYSYNWILRKLSSRYMAYVHHKIFSNLPIKYADGWIGKEYSFILPMHKKNLILEFSIPIDKVLPLDITIFINDNLYLKDTYTKVGENIINMKLHDYDKYNNIKVICKKTFIPSGNDNRKLSIIMKKIDYR